MSIIRFVHATHRFIQTVILAYIEHTHTVIQYIRRHRTNPITICLKMRRYHCSCQWNRRTWTSAENGMCFIIRMIILVMSADAEGEDCHCAVPLLTGPHVCVCERVLGTCIRALQCHTPPISRGNRAGTRIWRHVVFVHFCYPSPNAYHFHLEMLSNSLSWISRRNHARNIRMAREGEISVEIFTLEWFSNTWLYKQCAACSRQV